MDLREWRRQLRVAAAAGDEVSLSLLLAEPPPTECLQVWPYEVLENSRDAGVDDVPEEADGLRWIEVWPEGHAGRDLRAFILTVDDLGLRERLERSIRGKGAFRRFRSVLERWPQEASRWHAFNDDRRVGRARAWLAEAGYRIGSPPTPPA